MVNRGCIEYAVKMGVCSPVAVVFKAARSGLKRAAVAQLGPARVGPDLIDMMNRHEVQAHSIIGGQPSGRAAPTMRRCATQLLDRDRNGNALPSTDDLGPPFMAGSNSNSATIYARPHRAKQKPHFRTATSRTSHLQDPATAARSGQRRFEDRLEYAEPLAMGDEFDQGVQAKYAVTRRNFSAATADISEYADCSN